MTSILLLNFILFGNIPNIRHISEYSAEDSFVLFLENMLRLFGIFPNITPPIFCIDSEAKRFVLCSNSSKSISSFSQLPEDPLFSTPY